MEPSHTAPSIDHTKTTVPAAPPVLLSPGPSAGVRATGALPGEVGAAADWGTGAVRSGRGRAAALLVAGDERALERGGRLRPEVVETTACRLRLVGRQRAEAQCQRATGDRDAPA